MGWWHPQNTDVPPRKRTSDKEELQALVLNESTKGKMVQERKLLVSDTSLIGCSLHSIDFYSIKAYLQLHRPVILSIIGF